MRSKPLCKQQDNDLKLVPPQNQFLFAFYIGLIIFYGVL